jgi:hypothetical protein
MCGVALTSMALFVTASSNVHAAGVDPQNPLQPWQSAYPLVLDVDATTIPACNTDVNLKVSVYDPTAFKKKQTLKWRVRIGGNTYQTGLVAMTQPTMTITLTIPFADVPTNDTPLQVDAKPVLTNGQPVDGAYGRVWQDHISRGCNPVIVASLGDSIVWGQGNDHQTKMTEVFARHLGNTTGRGFRTLDYSISGAALDAANVPVGNDDTRCGELTYRQDPDNDGEMEFGEVTQQMPDVFCQIEKAKQAAEEGGYEIDAIVVTACINDIDPLVGIPFGLTPGSKDMAEAVLRECSGVGAETDNPAENVPYFSGAKLGYGGRGMKEMIEKAHREIPGNPKVIVVPMVRAMSEDTGSQLDVCRFVTGLPSVFSQICSGTDALSMAIRFDEFVRYQTEAYRDAVDQVNSQFGNIAVVGDGLYTLKNSAYASQSLVWDDIPGVGDPAEALRQHACPSMSDTPPQCLSATIMHPNIEGHRQFAESFSIEPTVRSWFATTPAGAPSAAFDVSTHAGIPPFSVDFDASQSKDDGDIVSYHWYFGDGRETITTTPTVTHDYQDPGPYLPRLVVTDNTGIRTMARVDTAIIGSDVPRVPAGYSQIKGDANIKNTQVHFDLVQALPFVHLMLGNVTLSIPGVGTVATIVPELVSYGPNNDRSQLSASGWGLNWAGIYWISWTYTVTESGAHLVVDVTGSVKAHIEGDIAAGSIEPTVRDYFDIF